MMTKPLKVLFVTAEVAPFSSVGGLSQVSYFLPQALKKLGVDIRIFTPKYGSIDSALLQTEEVIEGLKVPTGEDPSSNHPRELICNVKTLKNPKKENPIVYFLENMEYYEKRANVYNYSDDHIRFGLLSRGALEFIKMSGFTPDIIHANDWHTGYIPNYLKNEYKNDLELKNIRTIFSIHNLYQGVFDFDHASEMDFDDGKGPLSSFFSDRFYKQNALKRGIVYTDLISTVSQTYSHELLSAEYAPRLYNLFGELRDKLFGVLNGLDYKSFDPKTDKNIKTNYSEHSLELRKENKEDLQKEFNLKISPQTPILAVVGRLNDQKGIDLILEIANFIINECHTQMVICGSGEDKYQDFFYNLNKKYPESVGARLIFDKYLPRKIYAGADIILMPSHYEPGGIVALESMRYGCIPVVHATGGLADSVGDFDPAKGIGTGFTFDNFSSLSFLAAIIRALEAYRNNETWARITRQAMKEDFSWEKSAKKYIDLYRKAKMYELG